MTNFSGRVSPGGARTIGGSELEPSLRENYTFLMRLIPALGLSILLAVSVSAAPKQDGIISQGEYAHTASFGDGKFLLHWSLGTSSVSIGIDAESPGWVAIGFDPVTIMDKADMIFCSVGKDGATKTMDAFSTGVFGPHPSDLALGGKNDLRRTAGKRSGDRIVFEFVRRLDTNDKFDKPVPVSGDLKLIWACGESDDFESHHIKAGSEILNFSSGEQSIVETSSPHFLFFHAGFMLLAIVFMACGFAIARYQKRKKWWLYMHKALGAAAVVSATAGIGSILVYVTGTEGEHFGSPHGITGAVAFLLSAATLTLGVAMFKIKGNKVIRPLHRWTGRTTLLLMLANAAAGFFIMGVL